MSRLPTSSPSRQGANKKIGFIGLGIMGKSMATNLIRCGYEVTVYNRSKKSVGELSSSGAKTAESPAEVARSSDVVIDMVTDAPDVEEVILGPNGVVKGSRAGLIAIDMSTNSPDTARRVAEQLKGRGARFLDAPVSGGDKGAREGALTIMVGGEKQVFEECLPIFKCMGKEVVYMGQTGSGQAAKLANQVAVSLHTLATCESLLLGSASGLDPKDLLRVLTSGAASSWNLVNLGPRIAARDFEPGFKAAHILKDLRYVMQLAERNHLVLPGSATAYQFFNAVMADDNGEKGTQVLAKVLEKLSRIEINERETR